MWRTYFKQRNGKIVYFSKPPRRLNVKFIGESSYSNGPINVNHVSSESEIFIGSYTSIGSNVKFITSGGHSLSSFSTFPFFPEDVIEKGGIRIGNDVWIGDNVILMGGISIGDGSIIGAGSVVTKDTEPYGIYAGVPSRLIRYRYSLDLIEKLRMMKWWDLPFEKVMKIAKVMRGKNISESFNNFQHLLTELYQNQLDIEKFFPKDFTSETISHF